MTIILVCLVVALVVSLVQLRSPKPALGGIQSLLLVACVGLAVFQILRGSESASPAEAVALFEEAAANRLGKLVKASAPERGTVLVLRWDAATSPGVIARAQDRGFRNGLGESGLRIVIKGPADNGEEEALDTLLAAGTPVSAASLRGWIDAEPDLVAVVSFLDVPLLRDADFLRALPLVYLKASANPGELQESVVAGHLDGVVVDKTGFNPVAAAPSGLDTDSVFDLGFHLLTGQPAL